MNIVRGSRVTVEQAKRAATEVLLHNMHGPYHGLPRTAGWGYPEPYTRDLMVSALGILTTGHKKLIGALRRVLETLAKNQTRLGHVPGLVHTPDDRGSSDTAPWFLIGVALYRRFTGETGFLDDAVQKALTWMDYQSPDDMVMVAQQPTSDWRDEQWVLGYGLYVNTLVYTYLRLFNQDEKAAVLREMMNRLNVRRTRRNRHVHEGLVVRHKPYYALWAYKAINSERFDLLGNSLAILSGVARPSRASVLVTWIESESDALRANGELALDLPPCFFPYTRPDDPDWHPRYQQYNQPGEYHNGGVWPFVCGFYVAALVAAGRQRLAERKLEALTKLVEPARDAELKFGFNEWFKAQDGTPRGENWQTWSAAMYLYAAASVEQGKAPFFDDIRGPCRSGLPASGESHPSSHIP